ncbi:MAG: hypothetical protein ABSC17_04900 [Thermacetogeniaceae bacterium]
MFYLGVLIVMVIAAACAIPTLISLRNRREVARLKQRYRKLTFASPKLADEALRLQIVRLKNMAPGRSEQWYLERVIRELERGRMHHRHQAE